MKAKFVLVVVLLLCAALMPITASAQGITKSEVEITSAGKAYKSYLTVPSGTGPFPAVVLVHSINGLEEGYRTMSDQMAEQGFVTLALGWQTFERNASDAVVKQLVEDSVKFLSERKDVDTKRLGLTGFCAGGRFTMLYLPQITSFKAGVAWYGFPNRGEPAPVGLIDKLTAPMLIIHGTADSPSPIADIYKYAASLTEAKKYFELKVYFGEPHGFMLAQGKMRDDEIGKDAFGQMVDFFKRKLK